MIDEARGGQERGFGHSAAKLSIATPVIVILLGVLWRANGWETSKALLGLICMLLIGIGTLLAIVALCNSSRNQAGGVLRNGVLGLIFNGIFVLIFGLAFTTAITRGVKARQTQRALLRTTEIERANSRKSFNSESIITNAAKPDPVRVREQLENASADFKGQDAFVAKAWTAYLREIEIASDKWKELLREVAAAKVLEFNELNGKQELKNRQALVRRYKATSDAMRDLAVNSADFFRSQLNKLGATPGEREEAVKTLQAQLATRTPVLLEIRDLDTRMSDDMLGVLSLLETNWGTWSCPGGRVVFEDSRTLRQYNALLADLQTAGKDQVAAQQKLASLK